MTDDLAKRPVLRIYTEATSDKGGIWAFQPYALVHTVFVEESNYRDLEDQIEALTAQLEAMKEAHDDVEQYARRHCAEVEALTAERDRLKAKVARQAEQITGLEASRRKLESLTAGAHRRVADVEAERDRAIDDARDNAEYVDLVSRYRAERDAARAERDKYKRSATHSEDVVKAAKAEIDRLRDEIAHLKSEDGYIQAFIEGQKAMPKGTFTIVDSPELVTLKAEIDRLRGALKPFADEAKHWESYVPDEPLVEGFPTYDGVISVGDLRNARAALKGQQP